MKDYGLHETNRVLEGRGVKGWFSPLMGTGEGTDSMKHRVSCKNNE